MTLTILPKPSLDDFIQTCTPLARIDLLERVMQERVDGILDALQQYQPTGDPIINLARFLKTDEDFLGIALALINLSQEKFLRILLAEGFAKGDFETNWTKTRIHSLLKNQSGFAERIAQLLLDGKNSPLLIQQVTALYLEQLSLPTDWSEIIRDTSKAKRTILQKLEGEFSNKKGMAVEGVIRNKLDDIYEKYGVTHAKGQVQLVGKEVDHAIPSTHEPYVLIMTSYTETTSSSQTQRANEHRDMFLKIQGDNLRYTHKRVFVNFIDGAGWLARRSDLVKLLGGCDYIVNLKTLDRLEAIICRYVPETYFTKSPRPQVEG